MLNRISLFDVATPMLFVDFIITFRRGYPRWAILLWAFAMGTVLDIFSNTPGVTAAALTLTALLQPYLVELFLPREAEPDIKVSAKALGAAHFVSLAIILTLVFCITFFALETFVLDGWAYSMKCAGASTLLTVALVMAIEMLR